MATFTIQINQDAAGSISERTVEGKALAYDANAIYVYAQNGDKVLVAPRERVIYAERTAE